MNLHFQAVEYFKREDEYKGQFIQFTEVEDRVVAAVGNEKRTVRNILLGSLGSIRKYDLHRSNRQGKLKRGSRKQLNLTPATEANYNRGVSCILGGGG
jgi:hypothetical protein